nr:homeodomain-like protein [Tanacetum cinerariifolium]
NNLLSGFNGNTDLDSLSDTLDHSNGEAGDGYRLEDFVAGSGLCRERKNVALKPKIGHGYQQQECSPSPFLIYDMGIKRVGSSSVEALGEGSSYMDVALKPQIGHGYQQQECSPSPFLIYDMGIKRVGSSSVEALGEGSSYTDGAIRP